MQVGITTASVPSALVVPVTALLAQAGGGYAVEVVGAGETNHLVPVSLGLFDDAEGWCRSPARGWPPARKWWSRPHDLTPPPTPDNNAVAAGNGSHSAVQGAGARCR